MSIRNVQYLCRARSVALLGAGDLVGPIHQVNPRHRRIACQRAWAGIAELPDSPDVRRATVDLATGGRT